MIARDQLHTILDAIPEERLNAAGEALAQLADPSERPAVEYV
jgi:hypothetical protein